MKWGTQDLEKFLKTPGSGPFCLLFYSENPGHLYFPLTKTKAALPGPWVKKNASDILKNPALLWDFFQTKDMFQTQKANLLIEDTKDSMADLLAEFLEKVTTPAYIVLTAEYLGPKSKLRATAEKSPKVASIACFAPKQNAVQDHIARALQESLMTADPQATRALCSLFADHPQLLPHEIEQLRAYLYPSTKIELAHVQDLSSSLDSAENNAIQFFLQRDRKALGEFLLKLLKDQENPISMMKFFETIVLRFHQLLILKETGLPLAQAALKLKPPIPAFQLTQLQSALNTWTAEQLQDAFQLLLSAEKKAKTDGAFQEKWLLRAILGALRRKA